MASLGAPAVANPNVPGGGGASSASSSSSGLNMERRGRIDYTRRMEVDQKAMLIGARSKRGPLNVMEGMNGSSSSSSQQPGGQGAMAGGNQILQEENDEYISSLLGKVSSLKNVAQGIGQDVAAGNRILDGLSEDFERAGGGLKGTIASLNGMMKRGAGNHMCHMLLFVLFIFFLMWWFM
ncbi:unnamed protein product [Amoebophrya sp. A120]|nr:unnamed protein product [Amoebophrya sp. A120]|eukprot:GSA120T00017906001.1